MGGGTSSYREVEETDVVILWGSNARETHPIYFHHVLKAIHNGARMFVVDPRRTSSARWAVRHLPLHVGTDVALANAVAREILAAGHVGRYGSGVNPLRGQNNVQGAGDMGALPDRLPGFQHVENDALRQKFERAWGVPIPPKRGWHLSHMFEAMERGDLTALYVIGESPANSEADQHRAIRLLDGLDTLVVQDMVMTATAELADVVFPAAAGWCESEGTVTNSERRVQRVRRALPPPPGVRDDIEILCELARRLGKDLGNPTAEEIWAELRSLSPVHAGMTYARLEELNGIQWPCYDETHPGESYLHGRLWERPALGPLAPFDCVDHQLPFEELSEEFPMRLTTGRRLDSYNTGVQTGHY